MGIKSSKTFSTFTLGIKTFGIYPLFNFSYWIMFNFSCPLCTYSLMVFPPFLGVLYWVNFIPPFHLRHELLNSLIWFVLISFIQLCIILNLIWPETLFSFYPCLLDLFVFSLFESLCITDLFVSFWFFLFTLTFITFYWLCVHSFLFELMLFCCLVPIARLLRICVIRVTRMSACVVIYLFHVVKRGAC